MTALDLQIVLNLNKHTKKGNELESVAKRVVESSTRWKINTINENNILLLFNPGNTQKIIGIAIWSLFPQLKAEIPPILAQLRLELRRENFGNWTCS